jgi:hypothetical protein
VLIAFAASSANIRFPLPIEPDRVSYQLGLFECRLSDRALPGDEGHNRLLSRLERHGRYALPSRYPPSGNERDRCQ